MVEERPNQGKRLRFKRGHHHCHIVITPSAMEKPQVNANALEKAQRLRQEFAAHAGVLTDDLVAAARAERVSHVSELPGFSEACS